MSVYFVSAREVDLVKIGCAFDPVRRYNHLRTSSPIELTLEGAIPGGFGKERELHRRFAKLRVRGEWFMLSPELREEIAASTRPTAFTWAAVRKWVKTLADKTDPEEWVRAAPPTVAELRAVDADLAKVFKPRLTYLQKREAAGDIYFPFREAELEELA